MSEGSLPKIIREMRRVRTLMIVSAVTLGSPVQAGDLDSAASDAMARVEGRRLTDEESTLESDTDRSTRGAPRRPPYRYQSGPQRVALGHDLVLQLAVDNVFLDRTEAQRYLADNGNFATDNLVGIIASASAAQSWFAVIRYDDEGYVRDDDRLDPDEILRALRAATDRENAVRAQRGFPALHVGEWTERPHYARSSHRLTWALPAASSTGSSVNYKTRVLGRRGVVSFNLVTDPERLAADRIAMIELLGATTFAPGARYEDFRPGIDRVAAYGLAALVSGRTTGSSVGSAFLGDRGKALGVLALVAGVAAASAALSRYRHRVANRSPRDDAQR